MNPRHKTTSIVSLSATMFCLSVGVLVGAENPPSPEWTKDLVIYEIATKAFTSPNGPQSGTFNSLKTRLAYLQDLGITGIWLTGSSVSDPHHFYNIWTQYAVIEPDQLDPTLGTPEDFKDLIDEAHRRGIRVFLDVIGHGVMPESTLFRRHPEWFREGSWGMVDYDWQGGHTDLDDWWVKAWTGYITSYGVDGFRLDERIFRPDLWARIRENALSLGHPIVIFGELPPMIPGVTDFSQADNPISNERTGELDAGFTGDIPSVIRRRYECPANYAVHIDYSDGTRADGSSERPDTMQVAFDGYTINHASLQGSLPDGLSQARLSISGVRDTPVKTMTVKRLDNCGPAAPTTWTSEWPSDGTESPRVEWEGTAPRLTLYLSSFHGFGSSVQLSAHDNGWEGFPLDQNPYAGRGSRATLGYSFLLTPMIPIFMAGEEFDADYHALPSLSPNLYGGKDPGKGRWLYGAQLNWSDLERPHHRAMLEDVRRILAIRRQERAVLAAVVQGDIEPRLTALSYRSDISVPVPYMRWNGGTAIIVVANRNTRSDARLTINIPVDKLTSSGTVKYLVADLWNKRGSKVLSARQLHGYPITVRRDNTSRGGLEIIKIQVLQSDH